MDSNEIALQVRKAATDYRMAIRAELEQLKSKTTEDEYRRELIRVISVRRGNISSSEIPSVTNFLELTEREEAIRALDRMGSGY